MDHNIPIEHRRTGVLINYFALIMVLVFFDLQNTALVYPTGQDLH
jgi:hypothetical protein